MTSSVQILADSINTLTGDRLTTFLLPRFPKVLLQELNTHRMLSRNAASSRAIPIAKVIERVQQDPYVPTWTAHKKGMQGQIIEDRRTKEEADLVWFRALDNACAEAEKLIKLGIHKQNANRLLEPFMRVPVLVSATELDNFFNLRCDKYAHPDFRDVAIAMRDLRAAVQPIELGPGQWHTPFFAANEKDMPWKDRIKIAVARAARISYTTHDGKFDLEADIKLHDSLLASGHLSPFEHCAMAVASDETNTRNYRGWYSYRAELEDRQG